MHGIHCTHSSKCRYIKHIVSDGGDGSNDGVGSSGGGVDGALFFQAA